ncbi:unnamed protein product [Miscanthus lutarioriparius]|uniref:Uncharacterized protein n=1 Tax=Miscanthus lutarioriparius TaxID=422564 RepID=A0A811QGT5_9POAL|nr:unnamed protein product [Miscanthus lutarioriparius]
MVNADHGGEPSSSLGGEHDVASDNAYFITMNDLVQDLADGSGGDEDGEPAPKDAELFEELINRLDNDDVLFGSPRWLDNFKEMK